MAASDSGIKNAIVIEDQAQIPKQYSENIVINNFITKFKAAEAKNNEVISVLLFYPHGRIRFHYTACSYSGGYTYVEFLPFAKGFLHFEYYKDYSDFIYWYEIIKEFLKKNKKFQFYSFDQIIWCCSTGAIFNFIPSLENCVEEINNITI